MVQTFHRHNGLTPECVVTYYYEGAETLLFELQLGSVINIQRMRERPVKLAGSASSREYWGARNAAMTRVALHRMALCRVLAYLITRTFAGY